MYKFMLLPSLNKRHEGIGMLWDVTIGSGGNQPYAIQSGTSPLMFRVNGGPHVLIMQSWVFA